MKKLILLSIFCILITAKSFATPTLSVSCNFVNDVCNEGTGSATALVTGGVPPYIYSWSNGSTSSNLSGLFAGTYTLHVADGNGDTASTSFTINNDLYLTINHGSTLALGYDSSGTIQIDPVNGTGFYSALICNSQTFSGPTYIAVNNLPAFTSTPYSSCGMSGLMLGMQYDIVVTDALGCTASFSDAVGAYGFADPTPTALGACAGSPTGQTNDTLELVDVAENITWQSVQAKVVLYNQGGIVALDSTTVNVFPQTYGFANLLPGNYDLYYYLYDNLVSSYQSTVFKTATVTVPSLGAGCGHISGTIYADLNTNCTLDVSEPFEQGSIVEIEPGNIYTNTDANGNYNVDLNYGTYTIQHTPSYGAPLGMKCPAQPFSFTTSSITPNAVVDMADTSTGIDLKTSININYLFVFPGTSSITTSVINASALNATADSVVVYFDTVLTIISTNPIASAYGPGYVMWALPTINALAIQNFTINLHVPFSSLGDTAFATSTIYNSVADLNPSNDHDSSYRVITGSLDPNHKTVFPNGYGASNWVPLSTPYYDFQIEFQNTGTAAATNIVIDDTLDSKFNINSFIPLSSSAPYTWTINGDGKLEFTFSNINLPDSGSDQQGSKGFINYRVSTKNSVLVGDVLNNTAYIYFDSNPAIVTNTTSLTLYDSNQILYPLIGNLQSCINDSVLLSSSTFVPATLNWTVDSIFLGTGSSFMLPPLPVGVHLIELDAVTPYCSQQVLMSLNVTPNPVVNLYFSGDTVMCDATGATYQWYQDGNLIPNANDTFYVATADGYYSVVITSFIGCSATTNPIYIIIEGINSLHANSSLALWPNPGTDDFYLKLPEDIKQESVLSIYAGDGKLIMQRTINSNSQIIKVDADKFPTGIYRIDLIGNGKRYASDWIKN